MMALVSPAELLTELWPIIGNGRIRPKVVLKHRRATAGYFRDTHTIEIREDSWKKMHLAEQRLVVIHEVLHAAGLGHRPGFRTSIDTAAHLLYERIYGRDAVWAEFVITLADVIPALAKRVHRFTPEEVAQGSKMLEHLFDEKEP